uniref:Uncharacterized protein n=1 Tax=Hanusia phi TaxID=3032 RepID=A0A7S0F3I1_9CRYP|mmetsp:Transcript_4105/g.9944  ORF Transcript_4105/g.9944 Transcript_4105/m.9944 type:complete len:153 (+) Transcript_4105:204-662(+)|eukprot:767151-Hanusia_phi.AAC.2
MDELHQGEDPGHRGSYVGEIFFQGRDSNKPARNMLSGKHSQPAHDVMLAQQLTGTSQARSAELNATFEQQKATDYAVHEKTMKAVSLTEYRPCFLRVKKEALRGKQSMAVRFEGRKDVLLNNVIEAVKKRKQGSSNFPRKVNAQLEMLMKIV